MTEQNPFDFANPVSDPSLFAGRSRELSELQYYLDLAKVQKGIGLAIVGERTSGKTSFLNMASSMAIERGFLSCRMDLTSDDVCSEASFLRCLYSSLFRAAHKKNYWADRTEDVVRAYRTAVRTGQVTELDEWLRIVFPQALAMEGRASTGQLNFSPQEIVDDLQAIVASRIIEEGDRIALLIDEGNHLASNATMLQKLRYVMSISPGILVALAGTTDMLGTMDDVFAPIVRQFKRIRLKPFLSPAETRDCLLVRLKRVDEEGILCPSSYREFHELAQGQPYEAQLIAHYAYRRYKERPEAGFAITVTVLNDVLAEVERFRGTEHDRFASALRRYDVEQLTNLTSIVCHPRISLYDQAKLDACLRGVGGVRERVSKRKQELRAIADRFAKDKVITYQTKTKSYVLNGNQFDFLYAKLLARSKRVPWVFDERTLDELTEESVSVALQRASNSRGYPHFVIEGNLPRPEADELGGREAELVFSESRFHQVLSEIGRGLRSWWFRGSARVLAEQLASNSAIDVRVWTPTLLLDLGRAAVLGVGGEKIPTAKVSLRDKSNEQQASVWLQPASLVGEYRDWGDKLRSLVSRNAAGYEALGWTIVVEEVDEETPVDLQSVVGTCRNFGWKSVLEDLSEEAGSETVRRYRAGMKEVAEKLAVIAGDLTDGIQRISHRNNLAYLSMSRGDYRAACSILEEYGELVAPFADLPRYNLAVCVAAMGGIERARGMLLEQKTLLSSERVRTEPVGVVFVVRRVGSDGCARMEEVEEIELESAVDSSLVGLRVR